MQFGNELFFSWSCLNEISKFAKKEYKYNKILLIYLLAVSNMHPTNYDQK